MQNFLTGNPTVNALTASTLAVAIALLGYFALEPAMVFGQDDDEDTFQVTAQITGQIAFVTTAENVTLEDPIPGLTGGVASGTAVVAVNTNNATGYNMTIEFADVVAMNYHNGSETILNYAPSSSGVPDLDFTVPTGSHGFAFSVQSNTNTADTAQRFRSNGSLCNTGSQNNFGECWYNAADATVPVTLVNRGTATPGTGATTTLLFKVGVDANPSPELPTGFYTATATLTATENPT